MWRNVCLDRQSEGGIQMILRPFLVLALQVLDICEAEKLLLVVQDKEREWFFSVRYPTPPPRLDLLCLHWPQSHDKISSSASAQKLEPGNTCQKAINSDVMYTMVSCLSQDLHTASCYLVVHVHVVLMDIQNFFHKVLAVIFAKDQHPYTRRSIQQALSPFSSWAFNVCRSYVHFLRLNRNVKALCLYCTDSYKTPISVKVIQWYHFPLVTQCHSGEWAVSFKRVNLPELLVHVTVSCGNFYSLESTFKYM